MSNQKIGIELTLLDRLSAPLAKTLSEAEARMRKLDQTLAANTKDGDTAKKLAAGALDEGEVSSSRHRPRTSQGIANALISDVRLGDPRGRFQSYVSRVHNELEGLVRAGDKVPEAFGKLRTKFGDHTMGMLFDIEKISDPRKAARFVDAKSEPGQRSLKDFEGLLNPEARKALQTVRSVQTGTGSFNRAFIEDKKRREAEGINDLRAKEAFGNLVTPVQKGTARTSSAVYREAFAAEDEKAKQAGQRTREALSNLVRPTHLRKDAKSSAATYMEAFAAEAEAQKLSGFRVREAFSNLVKPTHLRKSAKDSASAFSEAFEAEQDKQRRREQSIRDSSKMQRFQWSSLAQKDRAIAENRTRRDTVERYDNANRVLNDESMGYRDRRKAAATIASMGRRRLAPIIGDEAANTAVQRAIQLQNELSRAIEATSAKRYSEQSEARASARVSNDLLRQQIRNQRELAAQHRRMSQEIQRDWHDVTRGVAGGMGQMWMSWGQFIPLMTGFALTAGTAQLVKMTAELEKQAAIIKMASEQDFAQESTADVSKEILRINRGSGVSIADTAKTYQAMIKADLTRQEAEAATKISTMLSKVTGGELTAVDAGESLASLGAIFDEKNYELLADKMKYAADNSKTSLDKIVESMKQASTISRQYGYSLEGTLALLMKMAEVGITGSAAGTAIRNMATDLGGRTKQSRKMIAQISEVTGINVSAYNEDGSQREEAAVIDSVAKALAGATDQQKQYILHTVMSERGSKALIPVLADYGKSLQQVKSDLESVNGTLRRSYDVYAQTMSERTSIAANNMLNSAVSSFMENASKSLSSLLLSVERLADSDGFATFLDVATKGMSLLFSATKFAIDNIGILAALLGGKLLVSGLRLAPTLLASAASFGKLSGAASTAVMGINSAGIAVTGFARFLPMLTSPIGIAVGAIGLLSVAFLTAASDAERAQKRIADAAASAALAMKQGRQGSLLDESTRKYTDARQRVEVFDSMVNQKVEVLKGTGRYGKVGDKKLRETARDLVWQGMSEEAQTEYNKAVRSGAEAAETIKALAKLSKQRRDSVEGEVGPPMVQTKPKAKPEPTVKGATGLPDGTEEDARSPRRADMRSIADREGLEAKLTGQRLSLNRFISDELKDKLTRQFDRNEGSTPEQREQVALRAFTDRYLTLQQAIDNVVKDIDAYENKTIPALDAILADKNATPAQKEAARKDRAASADLLVSAKQQKVEFRKAQEGLNLEDFGWKLEEDSAKNVIEGFQKRANLENEASNIAIKNAQLLITLNDKAADSDIAAISMRFGLEQSLRKMEVEQAQQQLVQIKEQAAASEGLNALDKESLRLKLEEAQINLKEKQAALTLTRKQVVDGVMQSQGNEGAKFMATLLSELDTWATKMPSFGKALADGFSEGTKAITKGWLNLLVNGKQSGDDKYKSESNAEKLASAERRLAEIDKEAPLIKPGEGATQGDYDRYNRLNSERNERRAKTVEEIDQLRAEQKQLESTKNSMSKVFAEGAQKLQDSMLNYVGESINQIIFGGIGELFGGRTSIEMQLISALNANTAALQGKSAAASSGGGGGWLGSLLDIGSTLLGGFFGGGDVLSTGMGGSSTLGGDLFMPKDLLGFKNGGVMTEFGKLNFNKYKSGGIARSPQLALFGEASTAEAFVPLPDGNRIPVALSGGTGGVTVIISPTIDARGADAGAVKRLENALTVLADNVVPMAVQGVRKEMLKNRRTPDF